MAVSFRILFILCGLTGVHSITTVSEVSVKTGNSISIPCLYDSKYINNVKYLCEGYYWNSCKYAVKTNTPDYSGKYIISDDKEQKIFTVTIKEVTNQNAYYWCVVEINGGSDDGISFHLSVTSGIPSLYVEHQKITGYIKENTTIKCNHSNSRQMKWCMLGKNCVTGSSGSIGGTTVIIHMTDPNVFTVTMIGLKLENSGWYWCAKGNIQMPVHLTVTEKPVTTTMNTFTGDRTLTITKKKQDRNPTDIKLLIIPLSLLILLVIVGLFIWCVLRCKHRNAESSVAAMASDDVIYSDVQHKKKPSGQRSFAEGGADIVYSSVVTKKKQSMKRDEGKDTDVTYSTLANHHQNI